MEYLLLPCANETDNSPYNGRLHQGSLGFGAPFHPHAYRLQDSAVRTRTGGVPKTTTRSVSNTVLATAVPSAGGEGRRRAAQRMKPKRGPYLRKGWRSKGQTVEKEIELDNFGKQTGGRWVIVRTYNTRGREKVKRQRRWPAAMRHARRRQPHPAPQRQIVLGALLFSAPSIAYRDDASSGPGWAGPVRMLASFDAHSFVPPFLRFSFFQIFKENKNFRF
jgi:hypothetical protein